ncbi:LacI family DNA-binding transcriptional regulator [Paenactinomyces guangxiensis]|uniref:Substrate-binding domain-containing protein n=1 Tax=Paenactinomyces guangxiensis TaxID=1490290 RepID=A0A7W1WNA7_9BACL|nr:substrate-binding domain-containing protein [Paenactinomyces guangxiensis]MBA4493058.1 substrate-binding domain-containing protein [Paenactinomyces guangxiensis]MBH8590093.1 substrate-binding domain-containing protein [Paenactinomyces guangxiensis]
MKKVTMAEVAKHANVSKSTVSQYLNKRYDYMSKKTKQRIEQAIRELGYQPNFVARSLKQKKTSTIGVIVANILHTFSTQIIRAIEDVCHESDYHVIVCNADDDPDKEKKYIQMLMAKQVDGLIVFPTGGNINLYQSMVKEKFPLVFVDRIVSGLSVDTVILDNEAAAKLAVNHFIEKGYERIGIVTTSLIHNLTPRVERITGFIKAMEEHQMPIRDDYVRGMEVHLIKEGLREMYALDQPPQAILAGNDLALMEILTYAKENKITIPGQLALIGIDEVSFANIYNPPLTTVKQPVFQMGKKAAELLFRKIENPDPSGESRVHRFEPELIERESC